MKLRISLFQSRVARRLFLLFLFSSLIPIFTLGYLSYNNFSKKFLEQSQNHLHQVSKTVGYTIIERLDYLHDKLLNVASRYSSNTTLNSFVPTLSKDDTQYFNAIAIKTANKKYIAIHNEIHEFPELTSKQLTHLQNNNAVVTFSHYSTFQTKILLIVLLPPAKENAKSSLMIAEINQKMLWDFENIIHGSSIACITTNNHEQLSCTNSAIKFQNLANALENNNESTALFYWQDKDNNYLSFYWTIFLEGKFATPPWLVVLSKPDRETKASLDSLKNIYPIVITLAFLLVVLLTTSQIRRNLNPLEKLQSGTKKIAQGDLQTRVEISSNDEFEDLANSFNDMANRLDKQFNSLSTMAEIDRIILSATNKNYVVDTVLQRLKDVVPCEYIQLSLVRSDSLNFEDETISRSNTIAKNTMELDEAETKLLLAHPKYLLIKSTQFAPKYAKDIVNKGVRSMVVLPIIINDILFAIVVLGFKYVHKPEMQDIDHAREMTDRIAVALSTASKEEKIYEQANFDSLTKLPNRTLLNDRLDQAMQRSRRDGSQIATLLIDLDRFKNINDSLGHTAGDQLLIEVATRLSGVISETDTLGRLSGDEFVVILSDIDYKKNSTSTITSTVESILNAIKYPFIIRSHEINVTASVGIAMYPADTKHTEDLLRFAEIAMYHAKSQGKGAYQFYSKDLNASSVAQLVLENNLRQAIRDDQLELHYQPQYDGETGQIICAEALLRWHHPELGDLSPGDVLPIADSSGLIVPIGDWVLRRACQQIRDWLDQGLTVPRIAVNLSAHQFKEQNLIKRIKQILREYQVDIEYLELEITEDTIMTDIDNTTVILRTLNELGIKLAVDDFGTGYSSLNYLAKFPIHYLKIDRSFIQDVIRDPSMDSIVSAIIALAHGLRLQVVAEGVETKEQHEYLQKLNCDLFQGNLLCSPIPPKDLAELLMNNNQPVPHRNSKL